MKKLLLLTCAACFAAANAFATGPYVAAKAKYVITQDEIQAKGLFDDKSKLDTNVWGGAFAFGGVLNYRYGDVRYELEYTQNSTAKKRGVKVRTQGVLFNAYYDFNLRTYLPIKPYVGAGIGWGHVEFVADELSVKNNGFAAQIGAGLNIRIFSRTYLDLGYRYMVYDDFDIKYRGANNTSQKVEYKPRAHEIALGLRYEF